MSDLPDRGQVFSTKHTLAFYPHNPESYVKCHQCVDEGFIPARPETLNPVVGQLVEEFLGRHPAPSGPAEEFAQTPGSVEVIPQYTDFRGTEALRGKPVCAACGDPIDTNTTYVIVGVNWHPYVPGKLYHSQCVPKIKPYSPVTELAAEVLRANDPHSENIKGPTPYSDKPPKSISFYTHNEAELTRLRTVVDRYRVRITTVREALQEILIGLDLDLADENKS